MLHQSARLCTNMKADCSSSSDASIEEVRMVPTSDRKRSRSRWRLLGVTSLTTPMIRAVRPWSSGTTCPRAQSQCSDSSGHLTRISNS